MRIGVISRILDLGVSQISGRGIFSTQALCVFWRPGLTWGGGFIRIFFIFPRPPLTTQPLKVASPMHRGAMNHRRGDRNLPGGVQKYRKPFFISLDVQFFTFLKCTPDDLFVQKYDWAGVNKFPGVHEPPPGGSRNILVEDHRESVLILRIF